MILAFVLLAATKKKVGKLSEEEAWTLATKKYPDLVLSPGYTATRGETGWTFDLQSESHRWFWVQVTDAGAVYRGA